MSDVTIVDNSTLTAVAACDTQASLRYVLGLTMQEDQAPLQAGTLAHAVLAGHLSGNIAFAATAIDEYRQWSKDAVPERDRLTAANVEAVLARWIETHPISGLPFTVKPELVEVGFAVPLVDDIVFVGRMDALVQDAQGAWWVLEHKTTGRLDETWRRRYRSSAQITGYVWAAQQYLQAPVVGCFVNGIEFGRLPTDTKKCRTHGTPYAECGPQHARFDMLVEQRAPHQLTAWRDDAIRLARQFQALKAAVPTAEAVPNMPMQGQFTGACTWCQFRDFCGVGRPPAMTSTIMRYDPWSPYEHATAPVR